MSLGHEFSDHWLDIAFMNDDDIHDIDEIINACSKS